jgi:hypothetical protein
MQITKEHLQSLGFKQGDNDIILIDTMGEYQSPGHILMDFYRTSEIIGEKHSKDILKELFTLPFIAHNYSEEPDPNNITKDILEDTSCIYTLYIWVSPHQKDSWDIAIDSLTKHLKDFENRIIDAFANASGDDDTFDYVPQFYYLYESLLVTLKLEDHIPVFRKTLWETEPEYPEFFTTEELKSWT